MATKTWTSGSCTCTLTDAGVFTVSGNGPMDDYTASNPPWKSNRPSIKSVIINNGVTSIGNYCFFLCTSLTSVTLGNSVASLGDYCFEECAGLTSITIPDSVTSISNNCFSRCSNLSSITIPASVTSIESQAFSGCTRLTSMTFQGNAPAFSSSNDYFQGIPSLTITYSSSKNWPNYLKTPTRGGAGLVEWNPPGHGPVTSGSAAISRMFVGSTEIRAVYFEDTLIWQ